MEIDPRPDTIIFRSFNEFNDLDRFLNELAHHGPTFEPIVRFTTQYIVRSELIPRDTDVAGRELPPIEVVASASYVREHGSVPDLAATFEIVNRVPEVVSLELYCGLAEPAGIGDATAAEVFRRISESASALGLTIQPGSSRLTRESDGSSLERALRYIEFTTLEIRASELLYWRDLRQHLNERGINAESSAFCPRKGTTLLVVDDTRVVAFDKRSFRWVNDAPDEPYGEFTNWRELTDAYHDLSCADVIREMQLWRQRTSYDLAAPQPEDPLVDPWRIILRYHGSIPRQGGLDHFIRGFDYNPPIGGLPVRLQRRYVVEWQSYVSGGRVTFAPFRQHLVVEASYVANYEPPQRPARTQTDERTWPNVVSLMMYCGVTSTTGRAETLSLEIEQRIVTATHALDFKLASGVYQLRHESADVWQQSTRHETQKSGETERLRTDSGSRGITLRRLLTERGVDPMTSIIAAGSWEGGYDFYIIVTANRRVFQFDYSPSDREVFRRTHDFGEGTITAWYDLTDAWEGTAYRKNVMRAMRLLDEDRRTPGRPIV